MLSFLKRSIEAKIIVTLGVILTALLGLSAAVEIWSETNSTYQLALKHMEVLANTIQKSLITDMREGSGGHVQQILEMVGTEKGILAVRIFEAEGKVLRSADRLEIGQRVPPELMENYKAGRRDFISAGEGHKVAHIIHPISNAPHCYGCHGKDREVIGVLSLDYSLAGVEETVSAHRAGMAVLFSITIFITGVAIYLMLRKMVSIPVKGLKAAMSGAEEGNLDIVVPVGSGDEIGSLQQGFNSMLARLKDLNEKTVEQQMDLARKEQELQLQQALTEKNKALESANSEVVEKNRYYMEMLSFISHELKSPLVVLKGYSELMLKGDLGEISGSQKEALSAMERNVEALQGMIANYMDLSRIERGELATDKRPVDLLEEVIRPVMTDCSDFVERASMTMRVEAPDTPVKMMADPALLKSAVGNLVSNAVKYGWQGSDVVLEVEASQDSVRLSVFNEGPGIPYGDLERVFDRFTRLDNSGTRAQKGSGLGLCIVKEIVELHGGKVWAESKEGAWAKITIKLPLERPGA